MTVPGEPQTDNAGAAPGAVFELDSWNCPICGESIRRNLEVCPYCGENVIQIAGRYAGLPAHRAGLILGFSIAGLATCMLGLCGVSWVPLAVAAWVMANRDLRTMQQGAMDPRGEGMTKAGKIMAIVQTCLVAVGILAYAVFFGFEFSIEAR